MTLILRDDPENVARIVELLPKTWTSRSRSTQSLGDDTLKGPPAPAAAPRSAVSNPRSSAPRPSEIQVVRKLSRVTPPTQESTL